MLPQFAIAGHGSEPGGGRRGTAARGRGAEEPQPPPPGRSRGPRPPRSPMPDRRQRGSRGGPGARSCLLWLFVLLKVSAGKGRDARPAGAGPPLCARLRPGGEGSAPVSAAPALCSRCEGDGGGAAAPHTHKCRGGAVPPSSVVPEVTRCSGSAAPGAPRCPSAPRADTCRRAHRGQPGSCRLPPELPLTKAGGGEPRVASPLQNLTLLPAWCGSVLPAAESFKVQRNAASVAWCGIFYRYAFVALMVPQSYLMWFV